MRLVSALAGHVGKMIDVPSWVGMLIIDMIFLRLLKVFCRRNQDRKDPASLVRGDRRVSRLPG